MCLKLILVFWNFSYTIKSCYCSAWLPEFSSQSYMLCILDLKRLGDVNWVIQAKYWISRHCYKLACPYIETLLFDVGIFVQFLEDLEHNASIATYWFLNPTYSCTSISMVMFVRFIIFIGRGKADEKIKAIRLSQQSCELFFSLVLISLLNWDILFSGIQEYTFSV